MIPSGPQAALLEAACVPRNADHTSGSLQAAEHLLAQHPGLATATIHVAALLADEPTVRSFLLRDPASASLKAHNGWDPLTCLCFSRYLRLDPTRSGAFVRTARALLEAGASANTGWIEIIDHPNPRPILESVLYGAACIARNPRLTRLLLEHGADPNDEEIPYHLPETTDNTILALVLETGRLNPASLACMLIRKADWHDQPGIRLLLEHAADPNLLSTFGVNALHQALRRDNSLDIIRLLLDHHADPDQISPLLGLSAAAIAARRGRGDVLTLLRGRSLPIHLDRLHQLIAACAEADRETIHALLRDRPALSEQLGPIAPPLLCSFAANGNTHGLECLLELGLDPSTPNTEPDPYWDIAAGATALHTAAWLARPSTVKLLLDRKVPVDTRDSAGRTPLFLAVKACVDSHWTARRSPESVQALLHAGASTAGIPIPSGYDPVDQLLQHHTR